MWCHHVSHCYCSRNPVGATSSPPPSAGPFPVLGLIAYDRHWIEQNHMVDAWKLHHLMCSTKVRQYCFLWPFANLGGFLAFRRLVAYYVCWILVILSKTDIIIFQWQHFGVVKYYLWLDQLVDIWSGKCFSLLKTMVLCHSAYKMKSSTKRGLLFFSNWHQKGNVSKWATLSYWV